MERRGGRERFALLAIYSTSGTSDTMRMNLSTI